MTFLIFLNIEMKQQDFDAEKVLKNPTEAYENVGEGGTAAVTGKPIVFAGTATTFRKFFHNDNGL